MKLIQLLCFGKEHSIVRKANENTIGANYSNVLFI